MVHGISHPTSWEQFTSEYRSEESLSQTGFSGSFASLSRWCARYRLAKSFKALDLGDEYKSAETCDLYSAIVRVFLTYSAFESYIKAIGLNPSRESVVKDLQDKQGQKIHISAIRKIDPEYDLFIFLAAHLDSKKLRDMLTDFTEGAQANVSLIARCIRHVFAHGILSANSAGLSAEKFNELARVVCDFLLDVMDRDFTEKLME